ncbi:MAG: hypothetical protein HQL23_03200, partial [Candidatus Omnitrophica bacterium]|nr:hypothetical protein [Candidatus Omnitrophota bacterium]
NKEGIVLRLSPAMKTLAGLVDPVIFVIEKTVKYIMVLINRFWSKDSSDKGPALPEFKAAVSLARASKLLGAREEKIVLSAAALSTRPVKDIIIPLKQSLKM